MPTALAWVVVALMVAWAPLFHAICIAPAESAAATHVMADGTVMSTAALPSDSGHAGHGGSGDPADVTAFGSTVGVTVAGVAVAGALSEVLAVAGPSIQLLDSTGVVGVIAVFAGLAVLTIAMFARRCRMLPARGDPPRRRSTPLSRRDLRAWRPTDVDLHRLGISRT